MVRGRRDDAYASELHAFLEKKMMNEVDDSNRAVLLPLR